MRSKARYLLLAAAIPMVAGCGVYLHDPRLEASTAEAKATFDSLKAPAFFATQRETLATTAQAEDAAVANYVASLRNEAVLSFVRPSGVTATELDSAARLRTAVSADLAHVFRPSPWKPDVLNDLERGPTVVVEARQDLASVASLAETHARGYRSSRPAGDRRPTDCPNVPPRATATEMPGGNSDADSAYRLLQTECENWRELRTSTATVYDSATGEIHRVRQQIEEARNERSAANNEATRLVATVKAALESQENAPSSSEDQLNSAIDDARKALEDATPIARLAGLNELALVIEQRLRPLLGAADETAGGDAPTGDARAVAALAFVRAAAGAADGFAAQPDEQRAGALLIGLAKIRHDLNLARVEVSREDRRLEILQGQLTALQLRAAHLARAQRILDMHSLSAAGGFGDVRSVANAQARTAASEALTAYVMSWNDGEIPYNVLRFRAVQTDRLAALERAEFTEQDYRAVLQPAIQSMADYGAGGVTTQNIVTLLGHLGIAGSILGQ